MQAPDSCPKIFAKFVSISRLYSRICVVYPLSGMVQKYPHSGLSTHIRDYLRAFENILMQESGA
jgi:hypothetical protein